MGTQEKRQVHTASYRESEPQPVWFGKTRRLVGADRWPAGTVSHLTIDEMDRHYHERTTEVYICTGGKGWLEVDGERIPLREGTTVVVEPGMVHKPIPDGEPIQVLVITSPPFGSPMDKVSVPD